MPNTASIASRAYHIEKVRCFACIAPSAATGRSLLTLSLAAPANEQIALVHVRKGSSRRTLRGYTRYIGVLSDAPNGHGLPGRSERVCCTFTPVWVPASGDSTRT